MTMTSEESLMKGICPECDGEMEAYTAEKIAEFKADMGMGDDRDFCDICPDCSEKLMRDINPGLFPENFLAEFFESQGIKFEYVSSDDLDTN